MRTFEGYFSIKWHKNDNGDDRPLTIDTDSKATLNARLKEIRKLYLNDGAVKVTFNLSERK